mgnify:CR=1 FL=1
MPITFIIIKLPQSKAEEIKFDGDSITLKEAIKLNGTKRNFIYYVNCKEVPENTLIKSGDIILPIGKSC